MLKSLLHWQFGIIILLTDWQNYWNFLFFFTLLVAFSQCCNYWTYVQIFTFSLFSLKKKSTYYGIQCRWLAIDILILFGIYKVEDDTHFGYVFYKEENRALYLVFSRKTIIGDEVGKHVWTTIQIWDSTPSENLKLYNHPVILDKIINFHDQKDSKLILWERLKTVELNKIKWSKVGGGGVINVMIRHSGH